MNCDTFSLMKNLFILISFLFYFTTSFSQTETAENGCLVVVPKQLAKNNDEQIYVEMDCPVSEFHFKVLNRWGQLLYETTNFASPLDFDIHARMKLKRKKLGAEIFQSGSTYIWQLEYKEEGSASMRKASGQLMIN